MLIVRLRTPAAQASIELVVADHVAVEVTVVEVVTVVILVAIEVTIPEGRRTASP